MDEGGTKTLLSNWDKSELEADAMIGVEAASGHMAIADRAGYDRLTGDGSTEDNRTRRSSSISEKAEDRINDNAVVSTIIIK